MCRKQPSPNAPILLVRLANGILASGVVVFWLVLPYGYHHLTATRPLENKVIWGFVTLCILASGLCGMALKLGGNAKVKLTLFAASAITSIYLAELGLTVVKLPTNWISLGHHEVIGDTRDKITVLNEIRGEGVQAYPSLIPDQYLPDLAQQKQVIFPLGGISNSTTVYCNENGYWTIYESDEQGYNNPRHLNDKEPIEIAIIGDSFAEGACVKVDENIAAVLRRMGYNTVSFGKGGNGPLVELATLIEYAKPIKPETVLWLYCENNDLTWLEIEETWGFLTPYLTNEHYSQNLLFRQSEIDNVLIQYAEHQEENLKSTQLAQAASSPPSTFDFTSFVELDRVRDSLHLTLPTPIVPVPRTFKDILLKAKTIVSQWGGIMYFVYLPTIQRYQDGEERLLRDPKSRAAVLTIVADLNISLIDMHKEIFLKERKPKSLFSGNLVHYNAEGYRKVASALAQRITLDHSQLR